MKIIQIDPITSLAPEARRTLDELLESDPNA